jgi:hypothetical protein
MGCGSSSQQQFATSSGTWNANQDPPDVISSASTKKFGQAGPGIPNEVLCEVRVRVFSVYSPGTHAAMAVEQGSFIARICLHLH